jgi:hypothetical protein
MTDLKPTSRKRKVSAVKEEATRLSSQIVRDSKGPRCQCGCGRVATDAAHIIGRVYSHTRTDLDNQLALSSHCHRMFTNHPDDWLTFLYALIGEQEYQRLKRKALDGVNQKFDWYDELDRLRAIEQRLEEAA